MLWAVSSSDISKITLISLIVLAFAVIVGVDVYLIETGQDTISWNMLAWAHEYPILPFLVGLVVGIMAGHLWPNEPVKKDLPGDDSNSPSS